MTRKRAPLSERIAIRRWTLNGARQLHACREFIAMACVKTYVTFHTWHVFHYYQMLLSFLYLHKCCPSTCLFGPRGAKVLMPQKICCTIPQTYSGCSRQPVQDEQSSTGCRKPFKRGEWKVAVAYIIKGINALSPKQLMYRASDFCGDFWLSFSWPLYNYNRHFIV